MLKMYDFGSRTDFPVGILVVTVAALMFSAERNRGISCLVDW